MHAHRRQQCDAHQMKSKLIQAIVTIIDILLQFQSDAINLEIPFWWIRNCICQHNTRMAGTLFRAVTTDNTIWRSFSLRRRPLLEHSARFVRTIAKWKFSHCVHLSFLWHPNFALVYHKQHRAQLARHSPHENKVRRMKLWLPLHMICVMRCWCCCWTCLPSAMNYIFRMMRT